MVKSMNWQLHGSRVEVSDTYKYLGVVLCFFGSRWAQALSSMEQRVSNRLRELQQFALKFHGLRKDLCVRLWQALVRPVMEYAAEIWPINAAHCSVWSVCSPALRDMYWA